MILSLDSLIKIMRFQCVLSAGQWSPIGVFAWVFDRMILCAYILGYTMFFFKVDEFRWCPFLWIDRSCERLARDFIIRIFIR